MSHLRESPHVVLLGGGACGMSGALELARQGVAVTVLEREPRVGGLCGTHERDGFRFDFGGHRFVTQNPSIDALVAGLLPGELLERQRSSIILNAGRRFRYPLELDDVLRQFGPRRAVRALASYGLEALRQRVAPSPDRTFEDWVVHRFGGDLYRTFFGPYTAKLWGIPPDEISADWAAQRISLPSLADVALRLLKVPRPSVRTYARRYRYPRLGIGQIFERFAQEVSRLGGEVRTGAEVVGLESSRKGRVSLVRYRDAAGDHELACTGVISSLALPDLARMLGGLSDAANQSAQRLRFRAIRLLNLALAGPPISPHTWMYVSEPRYLMSRIQEPLHRSPSMAPPGHTSLMLEIPCAVGDDIWTASETDLYERCLSDLTQLGFPNLRSRTIGYFSSFVREGYPIYHLGYAEDRRTVLSEVAQVDGLHSCGRSGAFRYIFMDTAMEMGIAAARALLEGQKGTAISELGAEPELREVKAITA